MTDARRIIKPTAKTAAEKIREFEQRLHEMETRRTVRVGDYTLRMDDDGRLLAVKPGAVADVGTPVSEQIELGATRGYVTSGDVAKAVSGGKTSSLSAATGVQVDKDLATDNAQTTADNAYAVAAQAVAQQESGPGGEAWNDSFDREQANDLGPLYDMVRQSGPNQYGTGGAGTTRNIGGVSGATTQEWMFRRLSMLNTAQQRASATWVRRAIQGQTSAGNAQLRLACRVDHTVALGTIGARWHADIEQDRCRIGYYLTLGGSFVNLSGWQPISTKDGDSFDLWVGLGATGHDRFRAALLRNNLTAAVADDIPENTAPLLANRQCAFGVRTSVVVKWWIPQAGVAPEIQAVNFADRAA